MTSNRELTDAEVRQLIGLRFKALRLDTLLNQLETAKRLGLPRSTISSIERGKHLPNLILTRTLCEYYKAPMDFLFTGLGLGRRLRTKLGTMAQRETQIPFM